MSSQQNAAKQNERAWDALASRGQRFTRAAKDDEFRDPLGTVDANNWLGGDISGKHLLCLAAGGGRQGPLYAAAGAVVKVVDISAAQLDLDRQVATERSLNLQTVQTSMDDLSMFENGQFDIVIHPVSTCYLPALQPVYSNVARVTKPGGIYISQHKQPASLQADTVSNENGYELLEPYYRTEPLPEVRGSLHREEGTVEFLHRWEQLIGDMCRAGFVIEDLTEPFHADAKAKAGSFAHRSQFVAPYVRIKARRTSKVSAEQNRTVWLPDT